MIYITHKPILNIGFHPKYEKLSHNSSSIIIEFICVKVQIDYNGTMNFSFFQASLYSVWSPLFLAFLFAPFIIAFDLCKNFIKICCFVILEHIHFVSFTSINKTWPYSCCIS